MSGREAAQPRMSGAGKYRATLRWVLNRLKVKKLEFIFGKVPGFLG